MTVSLARVTRVALLSIGIAASTAAPAAAQTPAPVMSTQALARAIGKIAPTAVAVDGSALSMAKVATAHPGWHRVRKGMLIGLVIGAALGVGASLACDDDGECDATPILALGGIGAGLGAGIGGLMNLDVAPIMSARKKGVALRVSWR